MAKIKFNKIKAFKRLDTRNAVKEVEKLERILGTDPLAATAYRPHKVSVNGVDYIACDAKVLNTLANQSGRGDYRILFQGAEYAGVAIHRNNGSYRMLQAA